MYGDRPGGAAPKRKPRRPRKPPTPTKTQVRSSQAQARQYASQGKSVEKQATTAIRRRQREVKDTKGASDIARANAYKARPEYAKTVRQARDAGLEHSGALKGEYGKFGYLSGLLGIGDSRASKAAVYDRNQSDAGGLGYGVDIPRTESELRKFLLGVGGLPPAKKEESAIPRQPRGGPAIDVPGPRAFMPEDESGLHIKRTEKDLRDYLSNRLLVPRKFQVQKTGGGYGAIHAAAAPSIFALHQVVRPAHGILSAANAAVEGKGVGGSLKAGAQGFLHEDEAKTGYDLVKKLGVKNNVLAAALGLGVDIAIDPVTYASVGTNIPAKVFAQRGAERAAEDAAQAAAKQGLGASERAAAESAAYKKTYDALYDAHPGKGRGVNAGMRLHVPLTKKTARVTSPTLGSRVGAKTRVKVAAKVENTRPGAAVRRGVAAVNPDIRPAGVDQATWNVLRQAGRIQRGTQNTLERDAMNKARGLAKAHGSDDWRSFIHGLETEGPLTREQSWFHDQLQSMGIDLRQRGLLEGNRNRGAAPHVPEPVITRKAAQGEKPVGLEAAKARRDSAQKAHRQAKAEADKLKVQYQHNFGRASVLSRNVGGVRAEHIAERGLPARKTPPPPEDQFIHVVRDTGVAADTKLAQIRKEGLKPTNGAERVYVWAPGHAGRAADFGKHGKAVEVVIDGRGLEAHGEGAARTFVGHVPANRLWLRAADGSLTPLVARNEPLTQFAAGGHGVTDLARKWQAADAKVKRLSYAHQQAHEKYVRAQAHAQTERLFIGDRQKALKQWESTAARYVPHKPETELSRPKTGDTITQQATKVPSLSATKAREVVQPLHMQPARAGEAPFSLHAPGLFAKYGNDWAKAITRSDYFSRISGLGRPLTESTVLQPGEMVYRVSKTGLTPLTRPETGHFDPKKMAEAFRNAGEGESKFVVMDAKAQKHWEEQMRHEQPSNNPWLAGYDRIQGKIKKFQTIYNPAYQGTNIAGDLFMFRQGGGTMQDLVAGQKVLRAAMRIHRAERGGEGVRTGRHPEIDAIVEIRGRKVHVTDLLVRYEAQGLGDGGFNRELDTLLGGRNLGKAFRRGPVRRGSGQGGDGAFRRLNTARESLPRYASFIRGLRDGKSDREAAAHVVQTHFDYGDLTAAERGVRRVVPFYTFAARNTKLQAKNLFQAPGRLATYEKTRENAANAQGRDITSWERDLADFQQRGAPIPLPGGITLYPRLPLTDLNQFSPSATGLLKNITDRTSPLYKLVPQLATGRNFYFNEPINPNDPNRERVAPGARGAVPAPSLFGIGKLLEKVGIAHPIQSTKQGQGMIPGWNPYIPFLLGQVPQGNYPQQFLTDNGDANHGINAALAVVNLVTGVKMSKQNPARDSYGRALETINKLQSAVNDARQRGHEADADRLQDALNLVRKELPGLRGRAGYTVKSRQRKKAAGTITYGSGGSSSGITYGGGSGTGTITYGK